MKTFFKLNKIWYLSVFEVADYEFEFKIAKNKMTDPIWPT